SARWELPLDPRERAVCRDVWDWLRGDRTAAPAPEDGLTPAALREGEEEDRLDAAYRLGAQGGRWAPALLEELRREARLREAGIEAKTADNLHGTNPTAAPPAQALLAVGEAALPHLIEALQDDHWLTRAAV